jgi:F-type H+-transporting ATPase subunit delta
MAGVDDRTLALGRVYAVPMLDLAEKQGQADALFEELQELGRLLNGDPRIEEFLGSPLVDEEDRRQVLERLFRGRASDLLVNSLQVVNRHGRLGYLRAIAEAYRLEYRKRRHLVDARVRTAVPLSDALRGNLKAAIVRFTGKQPALAETVDPSLLGGMVVEVEGKKIDGSVASRLRGLSAALERRASQEIHRGTQTYIAQ